MLEIVGCSCQALASRPLGHFRAFSVSLRVLLVQIEEKETRSVEQHAQPIRTKDDVRNAHDAPTRACRQGGCVTCRVSGSTTIEPRCSSPSISIPNPEEAVWKKGEGTTHCARTFRQMWQLNCVGSEQTYFQHSCRFHWNARSGKRWRARVEAGSSGRV